MKKFMLFLIVIFTFFGVTHTGKSEAPNEVPKKRVWTVQDSKAYARDVMLRWNDMQFQCLNELWTKESNWRSNAYNKVKVMGKNAGGIPQLLGLSPHVPATRQIDRGYSYIIYRYGSPCKALKFHERKGWY